MRVITPQNGAFTPSGSGGGSSGGFAINYSFSGAATADAVVAPFSIGALAATGPYIIQATIVITNSTAATGNIAAVIQTPSGTFSSGTPTLTANGVDSNISWSGILSGNVTLEWSITGFTTGSADFQILASLIKLF